MERTMRSRWFVALTFSILFFLAAGCGGGGGGGTAADTGGEEPSPTLTGDNAEAVAGAVASAASALYAEAEVLAGLTQNLDGAPRAARIPAGTIPCASGGSMTFDVTDADGNGTVSEGDSLTVTFAECTQAGAMWDGAVGMSVQQLGASALTMDVTFENLTLSVGGMSWSMDGGFTLDLSAGTDGACSLTVSGQRFELAGVGALTNFTLEASSSSATYQFSLDGTLTAGDVSVTVETLEAFAGTAGSPPENGRLTATAGDGSQLGLEASGGGNVTVTVDTDGDSNPERTIQTTWNDLGAWIGG